jgi:hypothetical protein
MRKFRQLALAALLLAAGCVIPQPSPSLSPDQAAPAPPTREKVIEAFTKLNDAFRSAYEGILQERGSRTQAALPEEAFDALDAALKRLGMIVENRDPEVTRTLTVAAPAPKPLDYPEWQQALQSDQAMMGRIICPILGEYCKQVRFNPEDYVIVINAAVRPARGGSEVQLTTRMREIKESTTGMPRREYPPPTAVRMALNKIWVGFDQELAARQRRAR